LYDAGISAGKNSTRILLESWKERGKAFLEKWSAFYGVSGVGWFKIHNMAIDLNSGTGYIRLIQSFASEEYYLAPHNSKLKKNDITDTNPICDFLMGFFVGVFEEITSKKIECNEVKCIKKHNQYCEFQLNSYSD
jgi:hypothetical protein